MPQLEVRDSFNVQIFPEGMHVFHLPFSDDIRFPEKETSVVGSNVSRVAEERMTWGVPLEERAYPPLSAS